MGIKSLVSWISCWMRVRKKMYSICGRCVSYSFFTLWCQTLRNSLFNSAPKFSGTLHRSEDVHKDITFCTKFQGVGNPLKSVHGMMNVLCFLVTLHLIELFWRGRGCANTKRVRKKRAVGIQTTSTVDFSVHQIKVHLQGCGGGWNANCAAGYVGHPVVELCLCREGNVFIIFFLYIKLLKHKPDVFHLSSVLRKASFLNVPQWIKTSMKTK
jgi:hypothetical protein